MGKLPSATPEKPVQDIFTGLENVSNEKLARTTFMKTKAGMIVCKLTGVHKNLGLRSRTMRITSYAFCSTNVMRRVGMFSPTKLVVLV